MNKKFVSKKVLSRRTTSYLIAMVLVLIGGGVLAYFQVTEYLEASAALARSRNQLETLRLAATTAESDFTQLNSSLSQNNRSVYDRLEVILPEGEKYTDLAKSLNDYINVRSQRSETFFVSDIRFNNSVVVEDQEIERLPFTMSMQASLNEFMEFLEFVESTGDVNGSERLLDIESINLSYAGAADSSNPLLNVSLNLNAYFKPLENSDSN